jgi:hypothetical protein
MTMQSPHNPEQQSVVPSLKIRRRWPANVAATVALVLALTGSAAAAHHYLISSVKQIKPSVQVALHGPTGSTGLTGETGTTGATGVTGTPAVIAGTWGDVAASGSLIAGSGVTSVTPEATGEYCVVLANGYTPSTGVLVVTPDYKTDNTSFGANYPQAFAEYDSGLCTGGAFGVLTGDRVVGTSSGDVTTITNATANEPFTFEGP